MGLLKKIFRRKQNKYEKIGKLVAIELGRNRAFRREIMRIPLGQHIINICNEKD